MKNNINKQESYTHFMDLYPKLCNRASAAVDTIFEGTDLVQHIQQEYEIFKASDHYMDYLTESTKYNKQKVIEAYFEQEVLSDIFTEVVDNLIIENNNVEVRELTFSQEYIIENSLKQFNVQYKGTLGGLIEEGIVGDFGTVISRAATTGLAMIGIPASALVFFGTGATGAGTAGVSFIALLAFALFAPSRIRHQKLTSGAFIKGIKSLKDIILSTNGLTRTLTPHSLKRSDELIATFDNIDLNPEITKLFKELKSSSSQDAPINGIKTIMSTCIESSDILNELTPSTKQQVGREMKSKYDPADQNLLKMIWTEIKRGASEEYSDRFNQLIQYRKCLGDKLIDMYKFLIIANVSQSKDFKKISKVMEKGFSQEPEHLLAFIHIDSEEEELSKENIIALMHFRLELERIAKELKLGSLKADTEAGNHLTAKLKQVDLEISEYFSRNGKKIEKVLMENNDDFNKKDFKHLDKDEIPEHEKKRNLFNLGSM
jgi:hypothetical protein